MKNQLMTQMASRFGVSEGEMIQTLKQTAFKGNVTDAQMTALLIVANQYGLNPWTKEIYAFPDRGGIVPIVGVDGWARIINENPQFDGMDFEQDDESCTCKIYRKDRSHAVSVTEYMHECKREAQPWKSHPKRMLRHKAMIQCARIAFGFVGIYDEDEAERIVTKNDTVQNAIVKEDIAQELLMIQNSQKMADLQAAFGKAWTKFKDKIAERDELTKAYNDRKQYLANAPIEADFEEVNTDEV